MKKRRQSPPPIASESAMPTFSGSAAVSSKFLRNLVRARSTSSAVTGRFVTSSSVATRVARALSIDASVGICAPKKTSVGSLKRDGQPTPRRALGRRAGRLVRPPGGGVAHDGGKQPDGGKTGIPARRHVIGRDGELRVADAPHGNGALAFLRAIERVR